MRDNKGVRESDRERVCAGERWRKIERERESVWGRDEERRGSERE